MNSFVTIDVETANSKRSICQIGIAKFVNGKVVEEWSSLIDPETDFGRKQIAIHGINKELVYGMPKIPEVAEHIRHLLESEVAVCHTFFDYSVLFNSFKLYGLKQISTTWLNTEEVAKKTWKDTEIKGSNLSDLCSRFGYEYKAHDALEDAKAAGFILLTAINESKINLESWIKNNKKPRSTEDMSSEKSKGNKSHYKSVLNGISLKRFGNPAGHLTGEVIVFTDYPDDEKHINAALAAAVGCDVDKGVTKRTTILVQGDRDSSKFNGVEQSANRKRAEDYKLKGQNINIIHDHEFRNLIKINHE